ncbi:uncharacterized protein LOC130656723 [Hydractinia symbiolongicarpus]|uniref:uncharacterized protein LOC130656723 n=1 Tax=Hydractinia symbiolongicarpus TaxID=13093 RepID=UPI00254D042F|nr:uncharacterized protein LOC130656723 [Hydractinia symbiolongicarpus]
MQYPKCKSFSYMFHHSQCRIHHSTRTDTGSNLQKENGWTHYETNENATNVGPVCEERKPCNFGKCVDTCDDKGYKCEFTCSGKNYEKTIRVEIHSELIKLSAFRKNI